MTATLCMGCKRGRRRWERWFWSDFNTTPRVSFCTSCAHTRLAATLSNGCFMHEGSFHGGEAEELRAEIEKLLEAPPDDWHGTLSALLDKIDARDSLAHREQQDVPRNELEARCASIQHVLSTVRTILGAADGTDIIKAALRVKAQADQYRIDAAERAEGLR